MECGDWWNYDTEIHDRREEPPPSDAVAVQYIPRGPARNMYLCYRNLGLPILEAMIKALEGVTTDRIYSEGVKDESN